MNSKNVEDRQSVQLCTLNVSLQGVTPPIWRKLICPMDASLEVLSVLIQGAFDWQGYHLFQFKIGESSYECAIDLDAKEDNGQYAADVTLLDLGLKKGDLFEYEYDFGDGWVHLIKVEEVRDGRAFEVVFGCRGGERSAPFEDCGGPYAFQDILAAKLDKSHPRRSELEEFYDLDSFDPDSFDCSAINQRIHVELLLDDEDRELFYKISESEFDNSIDDDDDNADDVVLTLSVSFTSQLMADDPAEVLLTLSRLIEQGTTDEEAYAIVFGIFSAEFFEGLVVDKPFNRDRYVEHLMQCQPQPGKKRPSKRKAVNSQREK